MIFNLLALVWNRGFMSQLCGEILQELMPLEGLFRVIDGYYIPARYPDAAPSGGEMLPGAAQAGEAIETAENVYALGIVKE